jgi:hypothetical protein
MNLLIQNLVKKGTTIEVIDRGKFNSRTNQQNRTLHLWLRVLADYFGYTSIEECKRDIKREILGTTESVNRITGEITQEVQPTSRMSTKELSLFLDKLKTWAMTEHGVYLPMYTDAGYNELIQTYGTI